MNNITTVADHILLPHQADWTVRPKMERLWNAPVTSALTGAEDRSSVRGTAWVNLKFQVHIFDHVERARFDSRYQASLRIGKIAVPYWGKGVQLASAAVAGGTSLVLNRSSHGIAVGKYVLIKRDNFVDFDVWDLRLVTNVSSATLTVAALDNEYPEGSYVYILLFGKPQPEQFQTVNRWRTKHQVSVLFDARQVNAFSEDDFSDYETGEISGQLAGGSGWSGPWVMGEIAA